MKQIGYRLFVIGLFIFSFYYTNQVVNYLKEKDPLMQKIKVSSSKYEVEAIDAKIVGNLILPGKKGREIDYDKTYTNMKDYGSYNESLMVLKEVEPSISVTNYYDKYLIGGNKQTKRVSLLFPIQDVTHFNSIISILDEKEVVGTFFIDGNYLEKNVKNIRNHLNHEFELLSYQQQYQESFFKTSLSYLENITRRKLKYCYTEQENQSLLKMCTKLKLHTVKSPLIRKNIYQEVKNQLSNGILLSFTINKELEQELPIIIDYIKAKGYQIVSLEKLLAE